MGAHVEVRRGIRSASGRAELWRGLRRRLDEYSLTLRLLLKRPLAAAGLLITLLYVGIAIAASFLPDRDVLQTNFTTAYPQPPWWWGNGTPGSWFGTTYPGIDLGMAIFKAIRIDLYYSSIVVLGGAIVGMLVGLVAGYKGGLFDEGLMRSTDVAYSIPFLVFAIAVAYVISRDFTTLNLSLLILSGPSSSTGSAASPHHIRGRSYSRGSRS